MKLLPILFLLMPLASTSSASALKEYCDSDPTGELYSEIWDASVEQGFESIGLDPAKYKNLISKNQDLSLFELAQATKHTHFEVYTALKIWKLETCILKGYQELSR